MGIGNLGLPEILVILLIILLFFGAKRIPEIAGSFGKGIKEFKRSLSDVERTIREPDSEDRLDPVARARAEERLRPTSTEPAPRHDDESRPEPKRLMS
jgi:sec-independent protein translocase protein TatA